MCVIVVAVVVVVGVVLLWGDNVSSGSVEHLGIDCWFILGICRIVKHCNVSVSAVDKMI